jgi:hypothetical protein
MGRRTQSRPAQLTESLPIDLFRAARSGTRSPIATEDMARDETARCCDGTHLHTDAGRGAKEGP